MVEALDVKPEHIWDKMREVAESVRDNEKTAVSAGHSVSKTYGAPRYALWFLICHAPATVITTAPTSKQIEQQFWRELRQAHRNAKIPLGGKLTTVKLDFQEKTGLKWFALGFSTKPDTVTSEATAFQGYHNDNMLIIFDEAAGIMPQIWKAAKHLPTSEGGVMRQLVQGNPTSVQGDFADAVDGKHGWHAINISVKDTPNYKQGRNIIPGVAGRKYEAMVRDEYGENSNEYKIRVLGQKPTYEEGTFFGVELAAALKNEQYGYFPHLKEQRVFTVWDVGTKHTVIWFLQFPKDKIRAIDFYYDSKGLGLPEHLRVLDQRKYQYAQHFVPWDVGGSDNRPSTAGKDHTGKYLIDQAAELGYDFTPLDRYGRDNQYAGGAGIIHRCQFHKPLVSEGWQGLCRFRKQLDPRLSTAEHPIYSRDPVKDWTEHIGSAWCGIAMAFKYHIIVDGVRIGSENPALAYEHEHHQEYKPEEENVLKYGLTG